MTIWNHGELVHPFDRGLTSVVMEREYCLYCNSRLSNCIQVQATAREDSEEAFVRCCPACGWWYVLEKEWGSTHLREFGGIASLRELDLNNIETPLDEVKQFLLAQYERRNDLHPRLFEETIASILRDQGYFTRVTAYSGDNGIDIYLDGPNDSLIGVQVKRWRSSIKIEQIHALGGALIVNGCTKGVFITTSSFQRGAVRNANDFGLATGIPIELIDASKLFNALQVVASPNIWDANDPNAPWNTAKRLKLWTT